jgi:hypothetical protein
MEQAASYSSFRKWRSILSNGVPRGHGSQRERKLEYSDDDVFPDNDHAMDDLVQSCLNGYVGWLLYHVGSVGTNGRRQLFYLSFVCRFYGLSRAGLDLLAQFGFCVNLTMFDEMLKQCQQHSIEKAR